jgi:DNA-binding IclR family transcriptional regulator
MTTSVLPKPPRIQSLARASEIIDVIAASGEEGVSLSEISRATDLNKTTAFNLIASLVTLRFIEQDGQSRRYRLGLRNLELGRVVQQRLNISHLARPILTELCRHTKETANLGLPYLLDLIVVDSYQGSRLLHSDTYPGWRSMYHCTALGKAFLARWDASMRSTVYRLRGLPKQTQHTITDIDTLEAQLARFLAQGYTLDLEENEVGVNGIATWIVNGLGEVAAAISVCGPSHRLNQEVLEGIAPDIMAAADSITAAIGGSEQPEQQDSRSRQ